MIVENYIYLDHAATTPMNPEVIAVMAKALSENFGNASSIYQFGKKNRALVEQARVAMADSIGARADEIIITSGGTESDNMSIIKTAEHYSKNGKHIISTSIEHPAVLKPLKYLETKGFEVTYLPVDENGQIHLEQVKSVIRADTILVSVMTGNNEVGSLQPIQAIGSYIHSLEQEIIFHTDAVQAYGVMPIDVNELNVDLLSVSAHKMYGPKGIGFLYKREGVNIPSLLMGGSQENKHRAGTENVPAIMGFQKAIEINQKNREANIKKLTSLKESMIQLLNRAGIEYSVNGLVENSLPHILSLSFPNLRSDLLLIQLDLKKIAVSAGSACTAGTIEPSHVLTAMYDEDAVQIDHTIRFSLGIENTQAELTRVVEELQELNK